MKISAALAFVGFAAIIAGGISVAAAQPRDGAVIHNTGSTNFLGYTIKVWSDGSATSVRSNRAGAAIDHASNGSLPTDLTRKFFADLKQAKKSGNATGRPCMKSASFGSATFVQYHGWTSPDLECSGDGYVVALAAEAHRIAATFRVRNTPMNAPVRRPMLPNEPRRAPETAPGQASPMPESSPPTP